MDQTLATRPTIASLVAVYQAECQRIRDAFAAVHHAEETLRVAFTGADGYLSIGSHWRIRWDDPEDAMASLKDDCWRAIVDRLEIRRMVSVKRWEELQTQIGDRKMPEITVETVGQLVDSFQSQLPEMLAEAVEEVFSWLRPRNSRYKTNSELEVPERVVLQSMVELGFRSGHRIRYWQDPKLTALENVFSALDGQGQITKGHYSEIRQIVDAPDYGSNGHRGRTRYFEFRTFANGNMHLAFLRLDLLARLNALAGGRRLRPAKGAA